MKKFLSVVSLLLVAAMLMATPIYVSASESEVDTLSYLSSNVGHTYVAKYLTTAPTPDGNISAAEYGLESGASASITTPINLRSLPLGNWVWENATTAPGSYHHNYLYLLATEESVANPDNADYLKRRASGNDFWFAHDDDNIYIAMYVDAPTWGTAETEFLWRDLAEFRIGINMGDATQ